MAHTMPKTITTGFGNTYNYAWAEVTEQRYNEMLEVLPPIGWDSKGFLVGEAWVHKPCSVANDPGYVTAGYQAFAHIDGKFYACDMPLTRKEWKALERNDILPFVRQAE